MPNIPNPEGGARAHNTMAPLAMSIVSTPLAGVAVRRPTPTGSAGRRIPRALAVRCRAAAPSSPADAPPMGATRVWHCPPPEKERKAQQACSTISKLPPHVLGAGGLDPATQSPQNQQAYLGSLAERFLPVNLSYEDVRVLNVDPPVFAIPRFVPADECDAIVAIAKGGKKLVRNVKRVELGAKLPAPVADGAPALVQRLAELSDDCKSFVRCDGAWLEGSVASAWGDEVGLKASPPLGAFAFEMPQLCVTAKGKTSDPLPDAYDVDAANAIGSQRRAMCRVFLSDPPVDPNASTSDTSADDSSSSSSSSSSTPDIDRDAYSLKFDILDLAIAPAKGTAIVTFPAFADGAADERVSCVVRAPAESPTCWMDLPIAVGLDEGGIRKPVSMSDVVVETVGTDANVGDAARSRNRQEWRADVRGAEKEGDVATETEGAVAEAARKKLDELKKQGL